MTPTAPTWGDVEDFLDADGWRQVEKGERGGSRSRHVFYEKTLAAISNGSFPEGEARSQLTDPQRRQMRDAMIFCAHVREKRDIFVTDDVKAFGGENTAHRQRIEALAPGTRIMTLAEFERFCRGVSPDAR